MTDRQEQARQEYAARLDPKILARVRANPDCTLTDVHRGFASNSRNFIAGRLVALTVAGLLTMGGAGGQTRWRVTGQRVRAVPHAAKVTRVAAPVRTGANEPDAAPAPGWPKLKPCLRCGEVRVAKNAGDRIHERCVVRGTWYGHGLPEPNQVHTARAVRGAP